MKTLYFTLFTAATVSTFAQSFTNSFDSNPPLGSNDPGGHTAAGLWYVDRFTPAAFDSMTFHGANRLRVGVNAGDYQTDSFYSWQGRKLYLNDAIVGSSVSAQLYIPSAWTSMNVSPSMWFTLYDINNMPADYPILSFFSSGSGSSYFRVFDGNIGWVELATPIAWDRWNTLSIYFTSLGVVYDINGTEVYTETVSADNEALTIANVMFQNKNYGTSYDAYWDQLIVTTPNLSGTATPEPASTALLIFGGGLALGWKRFRKKA